MAEHPPRRPAPGVVLLEDITTSAPGLRFAVRFPAAPGKEGPAAVEHEADSPHPLAGTGKLFLAVAVARLAERDPGLLASPLTIRGEHRAAARSGTLRRMSGELQLTVDDATALIVGTGDGACAVALLELLEARGVDILAEANHAAVDLGLESTAFTGLESSAGDRDGVQAGESWGEGLLGRTTPDDLCTLVEHLAAGGEPTSDRVLRWMDKTFEPAGLASALPGFGPRTVPHRTVSGVEHLAPPGPPGAPGCASVLILPADVGSGRPAACVAAYHPRSRGADSTAPAPAASAVLGSLGLAVATHMATVTDISRG
jgi:Beta-lactamase enzyme family